MDNNKGTLITIIVIVAVVLLGIVLWWLQASLPVATESIPDTSSTSLEGSGVDTSDTTENIQSALDQIDTGSTTQDLEAIDTDINSL
jgi:cytoskeletal protein RodZ